MHVLYKILEELDNANIHYTLARYRKNTVMICATVVDKRIEVEVFNNGEIETNVFSGDESIKTGMDILQKIIEAVSN